MMELKDGGRGGKLAMSQIHFFFKYLVVRLSSHVIFAIKLFQTIWAMRCLSTVISGQMRGLTINHMGRGGGVGGGQSKLVKRGNILSNKLTFMAVLPTGVWGKYLKLQFR